MSVADAQDELPGIGDRPSSRTARKKLSKKAADRAAELSFGIWWDEYRSMEDKATKRTAGSKASGLAAWKKTLGKDETVTDLHDALTNYARGRELAGERWEGVAPLKHASTFLSARKQVWKDWLEPVEDATDIRLVDWEYATSEAGMQLARVEVEAMKKEMGLA